MWKEVIKDWSFKKEDFKIGVLAGLFIISLILVLISSGSLNFKASWTKKSYDFGLTP